MNDRRNYLEVIESLNLLSKLRDFDPVVIGTPPLSIEIATSDIDVACYCDDLDYFKRVAHMEFGQLCKFQLRDSVNQGHQSMVAQFTVDGWDIELFCQRIPTELQWGVRHFMIERRLLGLDPRLKPRVTVLKKSGLSTEEAFALFLGLKGDPYSSLLDLENMSDEELKNMIGQQYI